MDDVFTSQKSRSGKFLERLVRIFSVRFTIELSLKFFVFILILGSITLFLVLRYRYLNRYSFLSEESAPKKAAISLPENVDEDPSRYGLGSLFDEFLSAIKLFGYIDRPIFHELTRQMETRTIIAGDSMFMDEEISYCLVLSGSVQVFVRSREQFELDNTKRTASSLFREESNLSKNAADSLGNFQNEDVTSSTFFPDFEGGSSRSSSLTDNTVSSNDDAQMKMPFETKYSAKSSPKLPYLNANHNSASNSLRGDDEEPYQGFRLLTEVGKGEPLSSLFTILNLFTEHVVLSYDESQFYSTANNSFSAAQDMRYGHSNRSQGRKNYDTFSTLSPQNTTSNTTGFSSDGQEARVRNTPLSDSLLGSPRSPAYIDVENLAPSTSESPIGNPLRPGTDQQRFLARAIVDTTIAVIPAEAFRRLLRMHKHSSANIAHVILSRLVRVTFDTGHNYLGLTSEVMRTERLLNCVLVNNLPKLLPSNTIESLLTKGQQLMRRRHSNPRKPRTDSHDLKSSNAEAIEFVILSRRRSKHKNERKHVFSSQDYDDDVLKDAFKLTDTRSSRNPGDIMSPSKRHRSESLKPELTNSDTHIRETILQCILKTLGISSKNEYHEEYNLRQNTFRNLRLVNYDVSQQKAVFTSSFDKHNILDSDIGRVEETKLMDFSNEVEVTYYRKGSALITQGSKSQGLFYVISGYLETVTQTAAAEKNNPEEFLFYVKPGGIAGYLSVVSGHKSFVTVKAASDVLVGKLSSSALDKIIQYHPRILFTLAKRLIVTLTPTILQLDFALEWMHLNPGQILFHQGDPSDAIYLILNGRLRAIRESANGSELSGEYGMGESVGEIEVLTGEPQAVSMSAIRQTELVKFPFSVFKALSLEHPQIAIKISRVVAHRMSKIIHGIPGRYASQLLRPQSSLSFKLDSSKLRTVAIVPISNDIPVKAFSERLLVGLKCLGTQCKSLTRRTILEHLGRHAFSMMGKLKLQEWFAELEEMYEILLFIAEDTMNTAWMQTCVQQADYILVIADASASPQIQKNEQRLLQLKSFANKDLVLLHHERTVPSGLTRSWLKDRPWIHSHHHVQFSMAQRKGRPRAVDSALFKTLPALRSLKSSVQSIRTEISKYGTRGYDAMLTRSIHRGTSLDDFSRLARRITGRAIGLVLGGGGARGISQVGILAALEEAGIPIDIVGGTSIGSFNGALYAKEATMLPVYGRCKKFCGRMVSIWRFLLDATYPATAYTTGHEFNRGIWKTFHDTRIEDLWLPFYTNSTNITRSRMEIHTSGYVWRYVRASMSLAGFVPPICDEGSMLVDGGYMDNLTVSYMRSLGADTIFAVDVGSVDDSTPMRYGDTLSGFWALLNRYNPLGRSPNVPTMAEIQARLAYISSVSSLERAKEIPGCIYMRPPINKFATLEFGKFQEIYRIGYEFGKAFLRQLEKEGTLSTLRPQKESEAPRQRRGIIRRMSI